VNPCINDNVLKLGKNSPAPQWHRHEKEQLLWISSLIGCIHQQMLLLTGCVQNVSVLNTACTGLDASDHKRTSIHTHTAIAWCPAHHQRLDDMVCPYTMLSLHLYLCIWIVVGLKYQEITVWGMHDDRWPQATLSSHGTWIISVYRCW